MESTYQGSYFAKITYDTCDRSQDRMDVFFEGEEVDFNFTKIGVVTMEGDTGFSKQEVLDRLKYTGDRIYGIPSGGTASP